MAFAGGLAREDHIFNALALGAPFVKLVCMGRLQQFMAGARKFSLNQIARTDISSANLETEIETGLPFITNFQDEFAKKILNS